MADLSSDQQLTAADVESLLKDPSPSARAATAEKIGELYGGETLSEMERSIASDIFRALIRDAEIRVRRALSETLKENPDVPHDVALALANDVGEVAEPVLESSEVLTDEDLISIIRTKPEPYQLAVARRAFVSESVSDALVDTQNENVVATLVANDGAMISEPTMQRVLDDFGGSERIKTNLAQRRALPIAVAERLVTLVSEKLREHILTHHRLSDGVTTDLLLASRERATIGLLEKGTDTLDVIQLVDQLHANDRLTDTIIVRALCQGDLTFFETALARRAGIPVANAYQLVHDRGELAMRRLFEKAGMAEQYVEMARIGVPLVEELKATAGDDRERFRQVMIERILTRLEEDIDPDNFDYLLGKLGQDSQAA